VQHTQVSLLRTERFLPLFATQALGAFNDNGLRYGITIIIVYDLAVRLGINGGMFVALGAALFIAPYFLFSAVAGQLADKYDKALLARRIKALEILTMAAGWVSLYLDHIWLHLTVLFIAGTQAAFFSPVKYGLLPQHLTRDELVSGNGLIEMTTFVSILVGTLFGGSFVLEPFGKSIVGASITTLAIFAYFMATRIPSAPPPVPHMTLNWNILSETRRILGYATERRDVFEAILGISWFWFVGVMMLTLLPPFTLEVLHADSTVANLFIATFTIGIGGGSLLANTLLRGEVSARFAPLAAVLMTIFLIDLSFATWQLSSPAPAGELHSVGEFLATLPSWRILLDLFGLAFFGGIYVVPLNALMQHRASPPRRARVIAANNVLNALLMTAASIVATISFRIHLQVPTLFLIVAVLNALAAALCIFLLPQELLKSIGRQLLRLLYRVEVRGMENYRAAGARVVVIANHQSFLDGPLLSMFLPDRCYFVVNSFVASKWWMKPTSWLFDIIAIDPTNPLALKTLIRALKRGRKIVIFPEGRISVTGSLMKVYEGPGLIAHLASAKVLPVRIDGAQYSLLSKMHGKLKLRPFPKVQLTFLQPVKVIAPSDAKGTELRENLSQKLYDVMTDMVFRTSKIDQHLFQALLDARSVHGSSRKIMEDVQRNPISFNRIVTGSFILGRKLAKLTNLERTVGVLLPNANASVVTIFGLTAFGKIPAMLNFSAGAVNMAAACAASQAGTIVTSRRFIEQADLGAVLSVLAEKAKIVYLEDVRASLNPLDKIYGLLASGFPRYFLKFSGIDPDPNSPAVILFTSGSEGVPKGVVLSHRNINANRHQIAARISFNAQDIAFNALPMFHAFGLTGGTLLPLLAGVKTVLYPSPLHYKIVPEMVYDTDSTIVFGTDTFLSGYVRNAHPYDFYAVRYVVAGAERVKAETRDLWMEKFGLRILEGYGATECSPVLSVNTPLQFRSGTTGRLLDGIQHRVEPIEGIGRGGRLFVKGPNVMLGYLRADNPGVIEPPPDGWYDTGDIVDIDDNGFITILGRAKRFSKIAGEMISLSSIESRLTSAFPDYAHAIVALPDSKKGEQLVLVTTAVHLERKQVAEKLKEQGATDLMIPRLILHMESLPALGSGKTDFVALGHIVQEKFGT
jgi:acyl-[acyl-carrier-protein]-phospholipid O-acyltransferase / long-chain-fatty-acid--[acyl-carrier-protein] ligase